MKFYVITFLHFAWNLSDFNVHKKISVKLYMYEKFIFYNHIEGSSNSKLIKKARLYERNERIRFISEFGREEGGIWDERLVMANHF